MDAKAVPVAALSLVLLTACASSRTTEETTSETEQKETQSTSDDKQTADEESELAKPKDAWIEKRVSEAKTRLQKTKAGKLVWQSIEAHGGLERWFANGPVYFHYNYQPVGDRGPRNTYQTVDTWASRARHQMANAQDREYGWDGETAWYHPADWEPPYDVRFWALTPYYFVGMPFVLADSGVNLEYEGTDTLEETQYDVVRVTFGEVGISPDDYYVMYFDKETHRVGALRYIVSYPKFFPDGGHSPPKLMTYDGEQTVDGIVFAEKYRFFMWKPKEKTDTKVVTNATLSDVEFRPETPDAFFDMPDGAEVVPAPSKQQNDE